jgi:hypothetical protein
VEDETRHGILLVCDISGYTAFVRNHARSASHARQITVRLLKAIVGAARPPLVVAELEGDAVFFAAIGPEGELPDLARKVKGQIPRLFRAFKAEVGVVSAARDCTCAACACISDLRLKQVAHAGEVAVASRRSSCRVTSPDITREVMVSVALALRVRSRRAPR